MQYLSIFFVKLWKCVFKKQDLNTILKYLKSEFKVTVAVGRERVSTFSHPEELTQGTETEDHGIIFELHDADLSIY